MYILEPVSVAYNPVALVSPPQNYGDYIEVKLSPTTTIKPDQTYRVILSNNVTQVSYNVTWSKLEIDIRKVKVERDNISIDENIAWQQRTKYNISIYEMIPQHNVWFILLGILLFIVFISPVIYKPIRKLINTQKSNGDLQKKQSKVQPMPPLPIDIIVERQPEIKSLPSPPPSENTIVKDALEKALKAIDKTHKWFKDEDEANRALTSCLKAMGFNDATYHYNLGNKRVADVFFEQSIIEGKLNPTQSDIDRLMGQLIAYLKFPFDIHIVIYGYIDNSLLEQLNEIIMKFPKKIFLTYLSDPNRGRYSEK